MPVSTAVPAAYIGRVGDTRRLLPVVLDVSRRTLGDIRPPIPLLHG